MQVFNNKDKCTCGEEGVYGTLLSAQFFHKQNFSKNKVYSYQKN